MLAFYSYNGPPIRMKRYMYRFNSIPVLVLGRKSPNQMQREPQTARFCRPRSGCALPPSVKPRSKNERSPLFTRSHPCQTYAQGRETLENSLARIGNMCIIYFKQVFARGRGPWAFRRGRFVRRSAAVPPLAKSLCGRSETPLFRSVGENGRECSGIRNRRKMEKRNEIRKSLL